MAGDIFGVFTPPSICTPRTHSGIVNILGTIWGEFEKYFFPSTSFFLSTFHTAGSQRRAGGSRCDTRDVVPALMCPCQHWQGLGRAARQSPCCRELPSLLVLSLQHPTETQPTKLLCPLGQDGQKHLGCLMQVCDSCSPWSQYHLQHGLAIKNYLSI